ncbi:unnamed protein product [Closterium sp. NIES-65]|nr:unnamed protein product [Closterium sp. NIES-65]
MLLFSAPPAGLPHASPSTAIPSTANPSTAIPSTAIPSTAIPSTAIPSTAIPSTAIPSTAILCCRRWSLSSGPLCSMERESLLLHTPLSILRATPLLTPPVLSSAAFVGPSSAGICGIGRMWKLQAEPVPGGRVLRQPCPELLHMHLPAQVPTDFQRLWVSESREVQEVTGDDWTCKDVYSMFGLTLKEFVGMNPGIDCSKVISTKYVNVKEYFPACSAFYYVQPNDTCASVAKFLNIYEEDLWRYNPGMINSCSRLPAFRSLCMEREPSKANWDCVSRALAPGVVNWKRFAVANGASTLDLVRLNPWLAFRDAESENDSEYVCVSATYS